MGVEDKEGEVHGASYIQENIDWHAATNRLVSSSLDGEIVDATAADHFDT